MSCSEECTAVINNLANLPRDHDQRHEAIDELLTLGCNFKEECHDSIENIARIPIKVLNNMKRGHLRRTRR